MSLAMRVRPEPYMEKGKMMLMPDYSHPETPVSEFEMVHGRIVTTPAPVPDGRIILCHPDDEQRVRDLLALYQEREGTSMIDWLSAQIEDRPE